MDENSTTSTCDICNYLSWRLHDVRLSRDKAQAANIELELHGCLKQPTFGFCEDVSRVRNNLLRHQVEAH